MKKLSRLLESDEALGQAVRKLEQHLDRQLGQRR
jgi:hypothetical protein